jgi:6-phosphofructokinase
MATAGNFALHGNLAFAHGGGTTAVMNASLYGVVREALRHPQIEEVYGARLGAEGLIEDRFLDLRRQSAPVLEALPFTPGAALGSSRRRIEPGDYERILDNLRRRNVRFLFLNGGNGTMLGAAELARLAAERRQELRVIGIPKTVDNDLVRTDHCPGYGSAARYLAVSALELGRDNEAVPFPVQILETMGRNAGWLAAATTLAARSPDDGPHLVYVPEIPFSTERFLADVERVYKQRGRVLVAVCEAIKNERGELFFYISAESDRDGFGRPLVHNVSVELARLVGRELGLRVHNAKPGLCTRVSAAHVSPCDREEARQAGEVAVRHALLGVSGQMVTLERTSSAPYRCGFGLAPLSEIGCQERAMPRQFMNEEGNYPAEAFRRYALPLLGEGLPEYVSLTA